MNKKDYMKPAMRVVKIQHTGMLMVSGGSTFSTTSTNLIDDDVIDFGGSDDGYTGGAR